MGVAGYVAPRHLRAMSDLGQRLVLACDPSDSVGILDSYFPRADFTTNEVEFWLRLSALAGSSRAIDYVSIVTPNHLHVQHVCAALHAGVDVLCEKPLACDSAQLEQLKIAEMQSGRRVFAVLQLRLHRQFQAIYRQIGTRATGAGAAHCIEGHLHYVTSRGPWYFASWKGNEALSGGILANIGVHLFDALLWIFGAVLSQTVWELAPDRARGVVQFEGARITWLLSVRSEDLSADGRKQGVKSERTLVLDGRAVDFSRGFSELHTESYRRVLAGEGWGIEDARPAIEWIETMRGHEPAEF